MGQMLKTASWTALKHVAFFIFPATVVVSYFGLLFDQAHDFAAAVEIGIFAAIGWFFVETAIGLVHAVCSTRGRNNSTS